MSRISFPLAVLVLGAIACSRLASPPGESLVFTGARVYTAPTEAPIDDAVVHLSGDTIAYVGPRAGYRIPDGATVLPCTGQVITAGFWNSHVHFIEPRWIEASSVASSVLARELQRTFLRHGFTTVFDVGSPWDTALALRERTASGEVEGPRILTVGPIVFPKGGSPGPVMSGAFGPALEDMPEADGLEHASSLAAGALDRGADGLKIYVATWFHDPPVRMAAGVVSAIARAASGRGKPVFAHPSDLAGVEVALEAGVDVLTHTTPAAGAWTEVLASRLVEADIAVTPTLTLWRVELERTGVPADTVVAIQQAAVDQLRRFIAAGGEVLFGTDVGYMPDDDPTEEYRLMGAAGMNANAILAALTTAPAHRFGYGRGHGRVAAGYAADLVVLLADPAEDVTAFARVGTVVRGGRVVYTSPRNFMTPARF